MAKEYECVQVDHHKKIAKVIKEYVEKGWILHTYQVVSFAGSVGSATHYLLFERE